MIQAADVVFSKFGAGGANEKVSPQEINDNQASRPDDATLPLKNCHSNKVGKLVSRKGYTVYSNGQVSVSSHTLTYICGIYEYRKFSGTTHRILAGSNGTYQHLVDFSTPASLTDITGAVTFTDDTRFDFCNVADTLVMTTEARDTPIKWTGTGNCAVLGGTPPSGKYCEEFFNYCFIANTASNPERVYWSGLFDPNTWTTGSDFKRLSDACTGMIRRGDELFLFTKDSITVVQYTGDSLNPFNFDVIDSRVGTSSNLSIVNKDGVLYWWGTDGHMYRMTAFKPERISELIPTTISELNTGAPTVACGIDQYQLNQYWLCVPKGVSTHADFVIAYDYLLNEIFFYDGMQINCVANFISSTGGYETYFGDRSARVYLTNNGDSDYVAGTQTAINWWKYSKQFHFGAPQKKKRLRRVKSTVNNGGNYTTLVDVIGDFGTTGGESITLSHNGGGDLLGSTWRLGYSRLGRINHVPNIQDCSTNAEYFQFKFYNNAYEQPYELMDFVPIIKPYGQEKY